MPKRKRVLSLQSFKAVDILAVENAKLSDWIVEHNLFESVENLKLSVCCDQWPQMVSNMMAIVESNGGCRRAVLAVFLKEPARIQSIIQTGYNLILSYPEIIRIISGEIGREEIIAQQTRFDICATLIFKWRRYQRVFDTLSGFATQGMFGNPLCETLENVHKSVVSSLTTTAQDKFSFAFAIYNLIFVSEAFRGSDKLNLQGPCLDLVILFITRAHSIRAVQKETYEGTESDCSARSSNSTDSFASAYQTDKHYDMLLSKFCTLIRTLHSDLSLKIRDALIQTNNPDKSFVFLLALVEHVHKIDSKSPSVHDIFSFLIKNVDEIEAYMLANNYSKDVNEAHSLYFQIHDAVVGVSEQQAATILRYVSSITSDSIGAFVDVVSAVSQLPAGTDFRLSPSLSSVRLVDCTTVAYATEFGLRDGFKKGPLCNNLKFFETRPFKTLIECMDDKYNQRHSRDMAEIGGPPGVGKSVAACHAAQAWSDKGFTFVWVSFQTDESDVRIVLSRKHVLISAFISGESLVHLFSKQNPCDSCFLDGITAAQIEFVKRARQWAKRKGKIVFVICSDAFKTYENMISVDPWTLADFKASLRHQNFRDSVVVLFAEDKELESSLSLSDVLKNPKATETDILNELDEAISEKYQISGGSARYMFAF